MLWLWNLDTRYQEGTESKLIIKELRKRLHAAGVEYYSFTADVWSTNTATHSLLSLTAHWVDTNFEKLCLLCCVYNNWKADIGNAIYEKFNSMLDEWAIEKICPFDITG